MCDVDVILIRNKKGTDDEVYIGRGSKWGNPYRIGAWSRDEVIQRYELAIRTGHKKHLLKSLHELKGKTLVCFCKPQVCHGDVLAQLVEEYVE